MKTILYIDPQGGNGNLGMYDYELISRLSPNIIYFYGGASYDYLPIKNAICRFWFKYTKYKNPILKGFSYIFTMCKIFLDCKRIRPDVIHIQWIRIPKFDILFYSFLRKIFSVKIVYTVHNILPHNCKSSDFDNYKKMYVLSDALIVHTETTKKKLQAYFSINPTKIHVAPHGPLNYVHEEQEFEFEIERIKKKLGLSKKFIFSILGYQSKYKGTDLLIEAWKQSKSLKNNNDVTLIIAGSQALDFLKEGEIKNVKIIDGFLSNITFEALMKISNVIILPYRKIDQSGILLTLISHNKPYCTTDVGELKKPIEVGNVGWVIKNISSDSIRETLEYIENNRNTVDAIANNKEVWNRIAKLYDWQIAANVTQRIYEL